MGKPTRTRRRQSTSFFPQRRCTPRERTLRQLKAALLRLAGSGCRGDFLLVRHFFNQLPELRNV